MAMLSVRLFSVLKQRIGSDRIVVAVPMPSTAAAVLDAVVQSCPAAAPYRPAMRLAVNQTYARRDDPVTAQDEVAVITPVSGG